MIKHISSILICVFLFSTIHCFTIVCLIIYLIYTFCIILLKIKQANCESCSGNIYPIFHGQYYSSMDGSSLIEEYKYCHFENITIQGIDVYSNGDLLLTYASQISNNPLNNSDIPSEVSSLVRIDSITGKTVWAKELINHFGLYYFEMIKSTIVNDVIWCFNAYINRYFNTPGVITKIDGNGSIIEIFYTPFTVSLMN